MSAYFTKKLTRPLPTIDGGTLGTVLDVQDYVLHLTGFAEALVSCKGLRDHRHSLPVPRKREPLVDDPYV
jgi:hypothetical protein